jgi:hypothetical protein
VIPGDYERDVAEFEKQLACVIEADGTVARGPLIDECRSDGINKYTICRQVPLQHAAKTNLAAAIGGPLDELILPGLITVGRSKIPAEMCVHTYETQVTNLSPDHATLPGSGINEVRRRGLPGRLAMTREKKA